MRVVIARNGKEKSFSYCDDIREAKVRFQWRYGYWPTDEDIIKTEEDDLTEGSNE